MSSFAKKTIYHGAHKQIIIVMASLNTMATNT